MAAKTRPCEICKTLIDPERAETMTDSRLCTEHAQQIARYGGEFLITVGQERISKSSSIKHNYGGVNVTKVRNHQGLARLKADYERACQQQAGNKPSQQD